MNLLKALRPPWRGRLIKTAALAPTVAVVALRASPAFAYHGTHGGGVSIEAILPIVVLVVLVMAGVVFWGRKKPKTKFKRRKRKQGR